MIISILTVAGALAFGQPAAPPAARLLRDLPNTTIAYYDVPGRNGGAIEKALKKMMADPALRATTQPYGWGVSAEVSKRTEGTKCTVISAKSKLTNTVNIPRLAEAKKVDSDLTKAWTDYITSLEADAAASLWFVADRLPALETSLAGIPCDQVSATWNGGIEKIKQDQLAFAKQRAAKTSAGSTSSKTDDGAGQIDKDY